MCNNDQNDSLCITCNSKRWETTQVSTKEDWLNELWDIHRMNYGAFVELIMGILSKILRKIKKNKRQCLYVLAFMWASLRAQSLKSLPAMQETWVQFLGWEDPLEKEMATHSIILAWRIPWTEEPGRLQSMGSQESDMTEQLRTQLLCNKRPKKIYKAIL